MHLSGREPETDLRPIALMASDSIGEDPVKQYPKAGWARGGNPSLFGSLDGVWPVFLRSLTSGSMNVRRVYTRGAG
jgi:hypothetical protein